MAKYLGKEMTRQDLLRSTGHISQIARMRSTEMLTGRGGGGKAIEVVTGGGLEFTVLQDKCLDVLDLRYKGINLSFIAKAGATAPQYYNPHNEFLYYFQGGMVATCGLRNAGASGEDEGEQHTLHGRIGNTPADNVSANAVWQGDEYLMSISGEMREAALFKENLVLRRRIETKLGSNSFKIIDRVDNETCKSEALMLLYHINFGFPFLGQGLKLLLPRGTQSRPRDAEAAKGIDIFRSFEKPIDGYAEQCFYHEMATLPGGETCVLLRNNDLGIAAYIKYNINQMPVTTQWKCVASGDYALGIEPANCHVEGKAKERREGTLKSVDAFGSAEFGFELGVLEGAEIDSFIRDCKLTLE
jgi:hypothetical protein